MFNFETVQPTVKVNKNFILSKLSDAQIFGYYFGRFNLRETYKSKFVKENNPSTGFYISKSGKIIYNHLNDKMPKMDCFAFVQQLYGLDFKQTVNKIAFDFGLISGNPNPVSKKIMDELVDFDREHKKENKISIIADKWNSDNLAFWKEYGITVDELKRESIYPIKKLFLNERIIYNPNNHNRYALTLEHKGETLIKVYSPNPDDKFKWINNIPLDVPFGLKTLNKDVNRIVVTKSQKDLIILKKFFPAVIATQNESRSAISKSTLKNIKRLYTEHFLTFDNDETGLNVMTEMEELGFFTFTVPVEFFDEGITDWSDLAKAYGLKEVEFTLTEILKAYEDR
jgi:hypothetical protein